MKILLKYYYYENIIEREREREREERREE